MFFRKEEKVFSLSGTSSIVPTQDISRLWSEFYAYLLVSGFYLEGDPCGRDALNIVRGNMSEPGFRFTEGAYNPKLGTMLANGLRQRFLALMNHQDTSTQEKGLLSDIGGMFANDRSFYKLSATDLYGVALKRNFGPDDLVIAHYVAHTFGQTNFLPDATLPRLYLSLFGNIHLSHDDKILVTAPELLFGSKFGDVPTTVTALWSHMSSLTSGLMEFDYPGNLMADMLGSFMFIANNDCDQPVLTVPRMAATLYMEGITSVKRGDSYSIPARFYQMFLYGHFGNIDISRKVLFTGVLDLMVKKTGDTRRDHLFPFGSVYNKLNDSSRVYGREPRRSYILEYAIEALDSTPPSDDAEDQPPQDDDIPASNETNTHSSPASPEEKSGTTQEPSTADGGFDPSVQHPTTPIGGLVEDEDTIDLISFDKTGEGVNEDLYRRAVIALNDRLSSDDSINVAADVKDALNHWVNGYIYRAAISVTKEKIASLGLQDYLKTVSI